ncbi:MAG: hypothetical protein HRT61_24395 [Ekhidna sp.]|nr:hypothetical protein [Ekhidna sp.]
MKMHIIVILACIPLVSLGQNRLFVGYHQAHVMERNEWGRFGYQFGYERELTPRWSTVIGYALDEYCRCDVEPYSITQFHFLRRTRADESLWNNMFRSSADVDDPAFSRLGHWKVMMQLNLTPKSKTNHSLSVGSGLLFRVGREQFFQALTWEVVNDVRIHRDWAIPIRLNYRYGPPQRWWSLNAFVLYQGFFVYAKDFLGNAPMNVLQMGVNIDFIWGKGKNKAMK